MHPYAPITPDPDELDAKADVVMVNYNGKQNLGPALDRWLSFKREGYLRDIIVVDNNSTDGSTQFLNEEYPSVKCIENDTNVGWGTAVNIGINHAAAPYVFVSNPDMLVEESWCYGLLRSISTRKDVGAATGIILRPSGEIDGRGADFDWKFRFRYGPPSDSIRGVDSVRGSGMLIDRAIYESVDGIADDLFIQWEEADLTLKMERAGYETIFVPGCLAWHCESVSQEAPLQYYYARNLYIVAGRHLPLREYVRVLVVNLLLQTVVTWGLVLLGSRTPSTAYETTRGSLCGALRSLFERACR
ncbi:glycosyltransferase family 2 protein [Halomicrobium sp. HM KBTZ05]|uniref:glycosyltransferase family 2 protein n=1 Tax=Halomicrobium sp. HM KBTZ05 TaxID=3242663 RepID=UPI003555D034